MVLVLGASSLLYAIEAQNPKVKNGCAELFLALKGSRLNLKAKKKQKKTVHIILHNHSHIVLRTNIVL